MNLLITGVSGFLGQALVKRLMHTNPFMRTVGLDRVRPTVLGPAHFIEADLRNTDIGDLLLINDIQVVIHLAVTGATAGADADHEILRRLLEVAEPAGVKRIVVPSRDWVYARAEAPCDEESPLRTSIVTGTGLRARRRRIAAWMGWAPVEAKLLVETTISEYRLLDEAVEVVTARLCSVIDSGRSRPLDAILSAKWLFGPSDYELFFQFLNIDDAANLLLECATTEGMDGAYNIAGGEPLSLDTIGGILEKRVLRMPKPLIRATVGGLSRLGLLGFGLGDLVRIQLGMPMCTDKAADALGQPTLTSRQALALWRARG